MNKEINNIHEIYCNQCGQVILSNNEHVDYLKVSKSWGYFSNKDLQIHTFYICESCYDNLIKNFVIPINIKNNNEAI